MADLADSLLPQLRASIAAGNLQGALADTQKQLAATGVDIMLATSDGQLHPINNFPSVTGTIDLTTATLRGQDVHATSTFADGKPHSWAATKVNARSVVFATLDRSGGRGAGRPRPDDPDRPAGRPAGRRPAGVRPVALGDRATPPAPARHRVVPASCRAWPAGRDPARPGRQLAARAPGRCRSRARARSAS